MTKKKVVKKKSEIEEEPKVSKKVLKKEDLDLAWIIFGIVIVFAAFLVPLFWAQSAKSFEFGNANWVIEDYENLHIFHGRFLSLGYPNLHYNIYLRNDPRTNNAEVVGNIDAFKYGGIISLSPEVDTCRGDLSRVMMDVASFLKQGVGVVNVTSATNDKAVAKGQNRNFVNCENTPNRTVVVMKIGDRKIVQDKNNPFCYTIYAKNCGDSAIVEKFMIEAIKNFDYGE